MNDSTDRTSKVHRVALVSLGCPKNQVDSELILGRMTAQGAEVVDDPEQADTLVINTCSFIDRAREESVETLLAAEAWKAARSGRRIIAAGCLVQRSGAELASELPAIDAFVGLDQIAAAGDLLRVVEGSRAASFPPTFPAPVASTATFTHSDPRRRLSPPWTAYVKIAEGCDQSCSFCAIPSFRGSMRSRPIGDLAAELRTLASEGVLEANLIAQDSTAYGRDLGLNDGLAKLVRTIDLLEQAPQWVRLHYLYPGRISEDLVEALATTRRIVPYIDLPLQHASTRVLRRMKRPGSAESYLRQLERLREALPDAGVRSAFIVGFPGESEEDFRELLAFVAEAGFDTMGIFSYSREEGTPAWGLADDIPAELKKERHAELEETFLAAAYLSYEQRVGQSFEVLLEGVAEDDPTAAVARWKGQAPEVDGRVLLPGAAALPPGRFARVRITAAAPLELVGEILSTQEPS